MRFITRSALLVLTLFMMVLPASAQTKSGLGGADPVSGYHDWRRVDPPEWVDFTSIAYASDGSGWLTSANGQLYRLHSQLGWQPFDSATSQRLIHDGGKLPLFRIVDASRVEVYNSSTAQWRPVFSDDSGTVIHDVAALPLPNTTVDSTKGDEYAIVIVGQRRVPGAPVPLIATLQPPSNRWRLSSISTPSPVTSVSIREPWDLSARAVVVTADTSVYLSHDEGLSFTQATMPPYQEDRLRDVVFLDGKRGWAVGDDGAVLTTTTAGDSWFKETRATRQDLVSVSLVQQSLYVISRRGKGVARVWTINTRGDNSLRMTGIPVTESPRAIALDSRSRRWLVGDRGLMLMQSRLSDDRAPWEPPRMFERR